MKQPLQITAHNFTLTEAIQTAIRERTEKLDGLFDKIISCRVVVDIPHHHKTTGILYNTQIYLTIPGKELVVKNEPHEDLYVGVHDAFDAMERQIKEQEAKTRGHVKRHEETPLAFVSQLFPEQGFGFITTPEGREIYMHANSVLNDQFGDLQVGDKVRFVESMGEEGPQASTVRIAS